MDNEETKKVGIVIDSNPEKNAKLKKKWSTVNQISKVGKSLFATGLVTSLLSPFDFEGPVVEIVTAAGTIVCFSLEKFSDYKLEDLDKEDNSR